MSDEQKPMTAREPLAEGWELTRESMALVGMSIPYYIHFQIDGRRQIRATRVAKLDELAKAISAIDEDIARLVQGAPALIYTSSDIEQLRQERAALIELQKRAGRNECPGSTTVIEALFPTFRSRRRRRARRLKIEQWLAVRKEAGLKIDPETAEVDWDYGQTLDPYGVLDEWELPEEFHQVGREYWARSPEATSGLISAICPIRVRRKALDEASRSGCSPRDRVTCRFDATDPYRNRTRRGRRKRKPKELENLNRFSVRSKKR